MIINKAHSLALVTLAALSAPTAFAEEKIT